MIRKFQLGGLQDALMLFVQGLAETLQVDPQQVVLIAQLNPEALKAAALVFQLTQDMNLAAQTFQQALQLKTLAMKHGAKLNYLKSLKHLCEEDEEVVYYKKGGSVECGCKKKGGEITKASDGWQAKFKNRKRTKAELDKINKQSEEDYFNGTADHKMNPRARREEPEQPKVTRPKPSTKPAKKDTAKIDHMKCGSKMKKEDGGVVDKFKAARCGSKMNKHQLGGYMNIDPGFYLDGKNKAGRNIMLNNGQMSREMANKYRKIIEGLGPNIFRKPDGQVPPLQMTPPSNLPNTPIRPQRPNTNIPNFQHLPNIQNFIRKPNGSTLNFNYTGGYNPQYIKNGGSLKGVPFTRKEVW